MKRAYLAAMLSALLAACGTGSNTTTSSKNMCAEAGEAAHYIAAVSMTDSDVTRAANQAVAERRYPAMGDKAVAAVGMLVITQKQLHKTPDEIGALAKQTCEAALAKGR
jgi:hypothetical protein